MPKATHVQCEVTVAPDLALGVYANAVRVLDGGDEGGCLLEFLVYSESEQRAAVVERVPMNKNLLPLLCDRITEVLERDMEISGTAFSTTG